MKINFILPGIFFSGGSRVVFKYCDALNEMGHTCNIYYPLRRFRFQNTIAHPYLLSPPSADINIATSWETAPIVNKMSGKKVYLIQHYEQWDYHNGGAKRKEIDDTYHLPMKHIITSHFLRSILPVQNQDDVIVHWGRELPEIEEKDYTTPKILYNLHYAKWKGNETLDPVLKRIHAEFPDIPIKSYGTPHVNDEELSRLFQWANIFVNASWVEGFGEPPLEAAGYGCAVIAPEQSAMPEMFTENVDMIFCKPKYKQCLYKSLVYLIGRSSRREIFGKNARAKASRYTFDRAVKEFERAILNE
jgi:glycosyltransferase involved in cell wall biosynthesis